MTPFGVGYYYLDEHSSDLEEAMTEVRRKLVLQKIKCSVIEKISNLHILYMFMTFKGVLLLFY